MSPPKPRFGFLDYVKAAFGWRFHMPLIGHFRANIWALVGLGILGIGNPAFWLLGLAMETGYLLFLAGSQRFQRIVDGTRLLEQKEQWTQRQQRLVAALDRFAQERYNRLLRTCAAIAKNSDSGESLEDLQSRGIGQLLWTFLQLLCSRSRLESILSKVSRGDLEDEITSTREKMTQAGKGSALQRSLQGSLDIAAKRLENLTRAGDSLTVVDAELERIEKQFALLLEESSMSAAPGVLTARLDGVMQSLQDTSRWMTEHKDLLGTVEEPPVPLDVSGRQAAKE